MTQEELDRIASWEACETISNMPNVDDAIRNLIEDPTDDNATAMVQFIIAEWIETQTIRIDGVNAVPGQRFVLEAPVATPAVVVTPEGGKSEILFFTATAVTDISRGSFLIRGLNQTVIPAYLPDQKMIGIAVRNIKAKEILTIHPGMLTDDVDSRGYP